MSDNIICGSSVLKKIYPEGSLLCKKGGIMKVSAISQVSLDEKLRRDSFIRFSNSFMSSPEGSDPVEQTKENSAKLGIENLQEFTIFPREVIDGRTVITA